LTAPSGNCEASRSEDPARRNKHEESQNGVKVFFSVFRLEGKEKTTAVTVSQTPPHALAHGSLVKGRQSAPFIITIDEPRTHEKANESDHESPMRRGGCVS